MLLFVACVVQLRVNVIARGVECSTFQSQCYLCIAVQSRHYHSWRVAQVVLSGVIIHGVWST